MKDAANILKSSKVIDNRGANYGCWRTYLHKFRKFVTFPF